MPGGVLARLPRVQHTAAAAPNARHCAAAPAQTSDVAHPPQAYASMIPDTLEEMEQDADFQDTLQRMQQFSQQELTAREAAKRERILQDLGVPPWKAVMKVRCASPRCGATAYRLKHCSHIVAARPQFGSMVLMLCLSSRPVKSAGLLALHLGAELVVHMPGDQQALCCCRNRVSPRQCAARPRSCSSTLASTATRPAAIATLNPRQSAPK